MVMGITPLGAAIGAAPSRIIPTAAQIQSERPKKNLFCDHFWAAVGIIMPPGTDYPPSPLEHLDVVLGITCVCVFYATQIMALSTFHAEWTKQLDNLPTLCFAYIYK